MTTIILVGCGNMGRAMLEGWLNSGSAAPKDDLVIKPVAELRLAVAALCVDTLSNIVELARDVAPEFVVFAVKPQLLTEVVPLFRRFKYCCTYVSIAAGAQIAMLKRLLGDDAAIIRCMPNTPAAIGKGMTVTYVDEHVTPGNAERPHELLAASGRTATIHDERFMDTVTAVSGSGPAYVFHFIECLRLAGCASGLPDEVAKLLAIQTVMGAAALAAGSEDEPEELCRKVTSPNGTTAAALNVLMAADGMRPLLERAVDAARRRSIELRS